MEWDNLQLVRQNFTETRGGEIETDYEDLWTLDINFNYDVLAGMLVIGMELLNVINNKEEDKIIFALNKGYEFIPIYTIGDFDENYYAFTVDEITKGYAPPDGLYGIWIKNQEENEYDMYVFEHPDEFMQGLITMANDFSVDFRDYISSLPFDWNDVEYDIPEYQVKEYLMKHK